MTPRTSQLAGWLLAAAVLAAAVAFTLTINFSPSFDAYGWLVWGRQTLDGTLNTGAAPSWKPLAYLFTVPYALAGGHQPRLWMITSTAAAFAAPVFAARIAYRLTGPSPDRPYAPWIAAVVAAGGVLGLGGYLHLILIASSDPMVIALCLGAVDLQLSGHPRIAFGLAVLASLGRPEVWPFAAVYTVWLWRSTPRMRVWLIVGAVIVPAGWFLIPAFTSKSPFIAGKLALGFKDRLRGDKLEGTVTRFLNNAPWPVEILWLAAIVVAVIDRDRTVLVLAGAAVAWVLVEWAFALHGWPAVPRYLLEPAALLTVLAAALIGRAFAMPRGSPLITRLVAPVAVVVFAVAIFPFVRDRAREAHRLINAAHGFTRAIDELHDIVVADGGRHAVLRCGRPVTFVGYESTLAWELGLNVGQVGHRPPRAIHGGRPIVFFHHTPGGWFVTPIHTARANRVQCARLVFAPNA